MKIKQGEATESLPFGFINNRVDQQAITIMSPANWEELNREHLVDCRVFQVYKKRFQHSQTQKESDFFVIDCNDWVQVLALTPERELIMVNQFRYGSKTHSWEVPGGIIDDADGDPITAGERELLEETGYAGKNARLIGWVYSNPAILSNRSHFVLIENCELVATQSWDEHEEIEIKIVPLEQALEMARTGKISHTIALNALFKLQNELGIEE